MTEAEELELLRLRKRKAMAAKSAPAATPKPQAQPSRAEAIGRGVVQGGTVGMGDEMGGAAQATLQALSKDQPAGMLDRAIAVGSGVLGPAAFALRHLAQQAGTARDADGQPIPTADIYRQARDADRAANARAEAAHKGEYIAGNLFGGLATAPLTAGGNLARPANLIGPMTRGQTLVQLMKQGAKVGGATGAGFGFGSSNTDLTSGDFGQYVETAVNTGLGGLLGGGLGGAVPAVAGGLGWLARNVGAPAMKLIRGGYVTPTPEAERLISEGAKLTLGRMDPASTLGRFEEIATSKATGGSLKALRNEAEQTTRDALLRKAAAPGAAPPTRGSPVASQIGEIKAGFTQAYDDVLDGVQLWPEKYMGKGKWKGLLSGPNTTQGKGAFEMAVDGVAGAPPSVRERALAELTDLAQVLQPVKTGPNAGRVDARSVQALRTLIKDELRKLGRQGEDRYMRKIYERARDFTTELLEGQLPPEKAAKLRAVDAKYADRLAVEKAARGAKAFKEGQGGEFTATQLLEQIRQGGSSPELMSLARDAHNVMTTTYPLTGVQGIAGEVAPLSRLLGPGFAHASNVSPWLFRHALTQKFAPGLPAKAFSATGRALEGAALETRATTPAYRTLYDLLTRPRDETAAPWAVSP